MSRRRKKNGGKSGVKYHIKIPTLVGVKFDKQFRHHVIIHSLVAEFVDREIIERGCTLSWLITTKCMELFGITKEELMEDSSRLEKRLKQSQENNGCSFSWVITEVLRELFELTVEDLEKFNGASPPMRLEDRKESPGWAYIKETN